VTPADLFLIAHKVRGEPAFDVATRMECPECPEGTDEGFCIECDNTGWWWIIPTSGHRAYPWWSTSLGCQLQDDETVTLVRTLDLVPPMPSALPDHYAHRAAPKVDLATALGIAKPKPAPLPPITRRF
jgi:hypothetical protein